MPDSQLESFKRADEDCQRKMAEMLARVGKEKPLEECAKPDCECHESASPESFHDYP